MPNSSIARSSPSLIIQMPPSTAPAIAVVVKIALANSPISVFVNPMSIRNGV